MMTKQTLPTRFVIIAAAMLGGLSACDPAICPPCISSSMETNASSPLSGDCYVGTDDPYQPGSRVTRIVNVAACEAGAPVAMRIITPQTPGTYAVVVFQHGYLLANHFYDTFLSQIASHGFVVVVPQMHTPSERTDARLIPYQIESSRALRVLDWLPGNLSTFAGVTANTNSLGLAGHSRGGKVAWHVLIQDSSRAIAVAGIEPTDSPVVPLINDSRIIQGPLNFPFPSLVIGAGLLSTPAYPSGATCASIGGNHVQFYEASASPAWHVVVPDGAHLDLLNDDLSTCGTICGLCTVGPNQTTMRQLTAGLLVAFFRAALQGDTDAYRYLTDTQLAPMFMEVESR